MRWHCAIAPEETMNAPIHTGLALSDRATPADVLTTINEGIDAVAMQGRAKRRTPRAKQPAC